MQITKAAGWRARGNDTSSHSERVVYDTAGRRYKKKIAEERKIQKYFLQLQTKIKNVKEYNVKSFIQRGNTDRNSIRQETYEIQSHK